MKKAFAASPILRACPVGPKDRTGVPASFALRFALCAMRSTHAPNSLTSITRSLIMSKVT